MQNAISAELSCGYGLNGNLVERPRSREKYGALRLAPITKLPKGEARTMSDPYLNCDRCGEQCACRATRDELERYKVALQEIKADTEKLLGNEDGGHEQALLEFILAVDKKVSAALVEVS